MHALGTPGIKYEEPSIGRVITLTKFRDQKIGRPLVAEAIALAESNFQGQGIRIGAKAHLQHFYGSLEFQPVEDTYEEDGIPHIEMFKPSCE